MATTYDAIQTYTLGAPASSIDFTSIAASWTDLRLILSTTTGGTGALFKLNNVSTGGLYSTTAMKGDGTTASSATTANMNVTYIGGYSISLGTSPKFTLTTIDLFSYANTSTYKTILQTLSADQSGSGGTARSVSMYRSTSAINQITLYSATFGVGTIATLYGIAAI